MLDGYAVVSKGLLADPATVVFTWSVRRSVFFAVVCRKSGARDVAAARLPAYCRELSVVFLVLEGRRTVFEG